MRQSQHKRELSDNDANCKEIAEPPTKRQRLSEKKHQPKAKRKCLEGLKIKDLECIVCLDLPSNKIYQCKNSHLLCSQCYDRIKQSKHCICPHCRVRLSRHDPSRNLLAEKYLEAHLFPCDNCNAGCTQKVQFKYLKEHSLNECKYRSVECKFAALGCKWKGLAKMRKKHNKQCPIKHTEQTQILKLVETLNEQKEKQQKENEEKLEKYVKISKLFEKRAHQIVCRDIRIDKYVESKETKVLNSNIFNALGFRWQIQMKVEKVNENNGNKNKTMHRLWVRLQSMSSVRKRLFLEVAVLRGPDLGYKLEPILFECEMNKKKNDSKWVNLMGNDSVMFEEEELVRKVFDSSYSFGGKLNLRVVLLDKRANGPSMVFRGNLPDRDRFDTFDEDILSTHSHRSSESHSSSSSQESDESDDDDDDEDESSRDGSSFSQNSQRNDQIFDDISDYVSDGEYF